MNKNIIFTYESHNSDRVLLRIEAKTKDIANMTGKSIAWQLCVKQ